MQNDVYKLSTLLITLSDLRDLQGVYRRYRRDPEVKTSRQLNSEMRGVAASIAEAKKRAKRMLTELLAEPQQI